MYKNRLLLEAYFCTRSRDRTGTGFTPLVFETSASTNSAIRASVIEENEVLSQIGMQI